jgi:hypothetical protein
LLREAPDLFSDLEPGARVGVILRSGAEQPGSAMVLLAVEPAGVSSESAVFPGYSEPGVDVLLLVEDGALASLGELVADQAGPALRELASRGDVLSFVMRPLAELNELGYEGFFERLGLAYMGACR